MEETGVYVSNILSGDDFFSSSCKILSAQAV